MKWRCGPPNASQWFVTFFSQLNGHDIWVISGKWFQWQGKKMWHYLVTNSNTFLSSENEVRPSVGPFFRHSILPSVCLSVCPSVRPTCERDILRTVSPIDFKFEIWYQITRITDAIDFGPSAKNKMIFEIWFLMSYYMKDGRYSFWAICLKQDGRHRTF